MSSARNFLLTGATGVVGLSIIELLSPQDSISVLYNTRKFNPLPSGVRQQIQGDITQPLLGLSAQEQARLSDDIDMIVHCAALTDFTAEQEALDETNLTGLKHVIALAEALDKPLLHVSTAFVHARDGHTLNRYEQSKKASEALIEDAQIPVTIARPSVIIGHSESGCMPKKQGMHNMLKLAMKNLVPVVPGKAQSLIDVIPRDIVAKTLLTIIDHNLQGQYWLTAGEMAISLEHFLNLGADENFREKHDITFTPPKLIHPETFDRLIKPVFMPALPKKYKRMFEETSIYLKYLNMTEPFPSSLADLSQVSGEEFSFQVEDLMAQNMRAYNNDNSLVSTLVAA